MEFLDKRKRQRGQTTKDVILHEKKDRRLLSYVPDNTAERGSTDRRGHEDELVSNFEEFMNERKSGIRYETGFDVILYGRGSSRSILGKYTGKVLDISNTGMLVEIDKSMVEPLQQSKNVWAKFTVVPGSMPEGYEMKVHQRVEIIRTFTRADDTCVCGIKFGKDLSKYAAVNKDFYMVTASSLMLLFICASILFMRAESIIYFKFNKWLYLYSIITALFLLSRYFFGALYRPKKVDPSFTPGVSILIPCFNEEEWIQRTILSCINQEYPIDKLEVIVIDDKSTDNSVAKIKEIVEKLKAESPERYQIEDRLSYYVQKKNAGKREALVEGALRAKHDLVVFVDSDSFLDPFAIRNLVQPFKDPKMGGVSGRTDVANTYTNALTKMQAVRYYIAFRIMKAAEGFFDCVTCLSGPLSCYRKSIILENKDAWLNQRFLGQKATFGDDRSMTNFVLRHHRATYQDTAVCSTIVPNRHKMFLKQQMRWKRSWLRESLIAGRFIWKKEPFAAVSFYMGLVVPIAAPIVVLYNLVYVPFTHHIFPKSFLLGLLLMSLLMSMAQLLLRKSSTWFYGLLFCIYYELVLLWQMPIAWFTFWKSTWGTRMTPNDIKAAEKKIRRRMAKYVTREYITVQEFADAIGIGETFIREQMEGRLAGYVVIDGDTKMIRPEAVEALFKAESFDVEYKAPTVINEPVNAGTAQDTAAIEIKSAEANAAVTEAENEPVKVYEQAAAAKSVSEVTYAAYDASRDELVRRISDLERKYESIILSNIEERKQLLNIITEKDNQITELTKCLQEAIRKAGA
ncbi:MAG: glycosyltransferase family 2 protein [Lachnospiraceae bacterium]|nr:glycosyltransferase family 2 protein [Lachnospiraceae bacterium]